jgi:hypothetical protein
MNFGKIIVLLGLPLFGCALAKWHQHRGRKCEKRQHKNSQCLPLRFVENRD